MTLAAAGSRYDSMNRAHPVCRPPGPESTPCEERLRTSRPIRVLLADDHPILRKGLADLVSEQPDMEIVGEAGDGEEAVEMALQSRPDVVLMDVTMPRLDGLGATRRIVAALPGVRVIGLSMHEGSDLAGAMLGAGATSYLAKSDPAEAILAAIRR